MTTIHREESAWLASGHSDTGAAPETRTKRGERCRVLAVASGGGHWAQLRAITANLNSTVIYATTLAPSGVTGAAVHPIPDANASHPIALMRCAWALWRVIRRERPSHLITTGAAPGAVAVGLGRLHGIPTVFVDSIANAEKLSRSGRLAAALGARTFAQWSHLSGVDFVEYAGTVFGE